MIIKVLEPIIVLLLGSLQLVVFLSDELLFSCNLILLLLDFLVHVFALLFFKVFVLLHVLLQLSLELLHVVNFMLLLLQLVFGRLQLLVLVTKSVYFGLQFVGLLLLYRFDVALSYALDLYKATVREPVPLEIDVRQCRVLVKALEDHSFDGLGEEVVCQMDLANLLVCLKGVYQVDQSGII